MSMLAQLYNACSVRFRKGLRDSISEELLFTMPNIGQGTAIILGATSATAFLVKEAVASGLHEEFVVIGGKQVGQESFLFTKLLWPRITEAGLPLPPGPEIKESDYAKYILTEHFKVPSEKVHVFAEDDSKNTQENMDVLKAHGFANNPSAEFYVLAGLARRAIGTARKTWESDMPISAHNCYPAGVTVDNWHRSLISSLYAMQEAEKILPNGNILAPYVRKGYASVIEPKREIEKVQSFTTGRSDRPYLHRRMT